jgi:hypothetical protein
MSTRRTAGAVAGLLLLAPLASFAADEAQPAAAPPEAATRAQSDGDLSALKVGTDPKTGALRQPSEAEEAELTRQMRAFWAQYPRHQAKKNARTGATSLVVAPHALSTSVASVGADGKVSWTCVEDVDDAGLALAQLREKAAHQQAQPGDR